MTDSDTTRHEAAGGAQRHSEPLPIGAIIPDVCAKIQARCQRTLRRLRTQRQEPARTVRLAG
jgi:hypothetical protein